MERFRKHGDIAIAKVDTVLGVAFGWAYVAVDANGDQVVDHSGEVIDIADLEKAAVEFNVSSRRANDNHGGVQTGELVESFVSTPDKLMKMGLPPNALPQGWWVGFKLDPASLAAIQTGERMMFSIEGSAEREMI